MATGDLQRGKGHAQISVDMSRMFAVHKNELGRSVTTWCNNPGKSSYRLEAGQ